MLGAGGTCEFEAPTERRSPASTSDTGFCACLRPTAHPSRRQRTSMHEGVSEGLPMPREPASLASAARMAKRSQRGESGCHDGIRERPATGRGQPLAVRQAAIASLTRLGFLAERTSGDGAWAAPRGAACCDPIAYAIGLPGGASVRRRGMGSPEPRERARLMGDPSQWRARGTPRRSVRAGSRPRRCRVRARRGGGRRVCRERGRRPRAPRPR
jgi:hypothetical protein